MILPTCLGVILFFTCTANSSLVAKGCFLKYSSIFFTSARDTLFGAPRCEYWGADDPVAIFNCLHLRTTLPSISYSFLNLLFPSCSYLSISISRTPSSLVFKLYFMIKNDQKSGSQ